MINETYKKKIVGFWKSHRRMPSYAEIMKLVGFKSKNAVFKLVEALVREGIISKDSQGKIAPKSLFGQIKVLGVVEAGFATATEEDLSRSISLDEFLIENEESSYMLTVKGDSMIDAGIQEGDLVVVDRGKNPKEGDIVIAEIDGGWTMKYYRRRAGKVYLEPANKKYPLIFPEQYLNIAAVVKAVIRKY
ncbi:MAG: repressor LexA [Candidatus Taylorbacteria bacterium]|nr:repressor LexA [Candidatus Taylorbacteria bacterium]